MQKCRTFLGRPDFTSIQFNNSFKVLSFSNLHAFHQNFGQIVHSREFIRWTLGVVDDHTIFTVHFVYCLSCDENEMKCKIKWNCLVCFWLSTSNKIHSLVSANFEQKIVKMFMEIKWVWMSLREQASKIDVPCKRRYVSEWSCLFSFRANRIYRLLFGCVCAKLISVFLSFSRFFSLSSYDGRFSSPFQVVLVLFSSSSSSLSFHFCTIATEIVWWWCEPYAQLSCLVSILFHFLKLLFFSVILTVYSTQLFPSMRFFYEFVWLIGDGFWFTVFSAVQQLLYHFYDVVRFIPSKPMFSGR